VDSALAAALALAGRHSNSLPPCAAVVSNVAARLAACEADSRRSIASFLGGATEGPRSWVEDQGLSLQSRRRCFRRSRPRRKR